MQHSTNILFSSLCGKFGWIVGNPKALLGIIGLRLELHLELMADGEPGGRIGIWARCLLDMTRHGSMEILLKQKSNVRIRLLVPEPSTLNLILIYSRRHLSWGFDISCGYNKIKILIKDIFKFVRVNLFTCWKPQLLQSAYWISSGIY